MRKIAIFIGVVSLLLLCAPPVYASGIPKLPHAFYGSVTLNGNLAPDGTRVSATVNIGDIIATQNPVTTVEGNYGIGSSYLLVQGYDIPVDAIITFHVTNANGTAIGGTAPFEAGGGPTRCDLKVTIAAPAFVGDGVGGAPPATYVETNLFGTTASFSISSEGKIQETIEATSEDGMLTLTIPKGTIALDEDGNPLESIEATIDESPPDPPEGAHIIGLAYNFKPDGATFDPPITLEYTYDPDALPEGVAEEDLVLAYYDEDTGKWVELECVVDTENNTITASVSHFTTIAIIGKAKPAAFTLSSLAISPTELAPEEKVSISVSVANTGGLEGSYAVILKINGVKEAEKSVTIAAGRKQSVTFSVTRKEAGSYSVVVDGLSGSFTVVAPAPAPPVVAPAPAPAPAPLVAPPPVPPPAPAINWPLLGGIIAGAVILIVVVVLLVRRRRTY